LCGHFLSVVFLVEFSVKKALQELAIVKIARVIPTFSYATNTVSFDRVMTVEKTMNLAQRDPQVPRSPA